MTSKVDICNTGLAQLGGKPINSVDSPTTQTEQWCKTLYDPTRQSMLQEFDWSFAMSRAVLTAQGAVPAWGYALAFTVPADLLRVIYVSTQQDERMWADVDWTIEQDQIMINYPTGVSPVPTDPPSPATAYMRYVKDVTDMNKTSALFNQALGARMAYELCIPVTENAKHRIALQDTYYKKLGEAVTADGTQGRNKIIKARTLISAR